MYNIEHFAPTSIHSVAVTTEGERHPIIGYLGIVEVRQLEQEDPYSYPAQWAPQLKQNMPHLSYVAATMTQDGVVRPAREIPGFSHVESIKSRRRQGA